MVLSSYQWAGPSSAKSKLWQVKELDAFSKRCSTSSPLFGCGEEVPHLSRETKEAERQMFTWVVGQEQRVLVRKDTVDV